MLVNVSVAAAMAGVSAFTIRNWIDRGLLTERRTEGGSKRLGHRRIDPLELLALLEKHKAETDAVRTERIHCIKSIVRSNDRLQ